MVELIQLNFSENYRIRLKKYQEYIYIFCLIRKKWFLYSPEEWVRQHTICYLTIDLGYSISSIALEVIVPIIGMKKRADIVVYNKDKVHIIVECKAPKVSISQKSFDQIARYNMILNSKYLMVTNGLNHFYCTMDLDQKYYHFLKQLPKKINF